MSSNAGNQEAGSEATRDERDEPVEAEDEGKPEVIVTDKRRFTPEGEPIEADSADPQTGASVGVQEPESAEAAAEIENLQGMLKEAQEKRVEAERQVRDFAERFRLAQAQLKSETEEQRARMQRTFDQKLEAARGEIIADLLETLDNLKRAISAAESSDGRESAFDSLLDGVRATAGMFDTRLQNMGLTPVPGVGEEFDPEIHEAVEIVPVTPDKDNLVIDEFQTGYKLGERLLRPARVRVGRAK